MLNPPQKLCRSCTERPPHTGRRDCLVCINKKIKDLAKVKRIQNETKVKVRKAKVVEKKRFSRSKLTDEADRVWSLFIRKRDAGKPCITCCTPWTDTVQAGHFMSRRHLNTRWLEKNGNRQCVACNNWGAGEQFKHGLALDVLYGAGTADQIMRFANDSSSKVADEEILEYIRLYYFELSQLGLSNEEIGIKEYYIK